MSLGNGDMCAYFVNSEYLAMVTDICGYVYNLQNFQLKYANEILTKGVISLL
jgi:hypothetical protein